MKQEESNQQEMKLNPKRRETERKGREGARTGYLKEGLGTREAIRGFNGA